MVPNLGALPTSFDATYEENRQITVAYNEIINYLLLYLYVGVV